MVSLGDWKRKLDSMETTRTKVTSMGDTLQAMGYDMERLKSRSFPGGTTQMKSRCSSQLQHVPYSTLEPCRSDNETGNHVMMNEFEDEMPMFDGSQTCEWFYKVERFFRVGRYAEMDKLDLVGLSLEGEAWKWFCWEMHKREFKDWVGLKYIFLTRFAHVQNFSPSEVIGKDDSISDNNSVPATEMVSQLESPIVEVTTEKSGASALVLQPSCFSNLVLSEPSYPMPTRLLNEFQVDEIVTLSQALTVQSLPGLPNELKIDTRAFQFLHSKLEDKLALIGGSNGAAATSLENEMLMFHHSNPVFPWLRPGLEFQKVTKTRIGKLLSQWGLMIEHNSVYLSLLDLENKLRIENIVVEGTSQNGNILALDHLLMTAKVTSVINTRRNMLQVHLKQMQKQRKGEKTWMFKYKLEKQQKKWLRKQLRITHGISMLITSGEAENYRWRDSKKLSAYALSIDTLRDLPHEF
ncbi:hypothetical protein CARUB_v10025509mg [Capsella rubella]|uniref:Uncharacterized protein n=1 Tax=Capsella rubella TaxID=81985 RepID=R0G1E9_9BRAS|nr:hypothetical protein CARUB_v10025509mg [Capsella rubella]